ncbi:plant intracellular Ras-group-related LRR protein 5-like [Eucalyptus grandis]|uniref:plant intracellular Ras-group-related LRR protein 5-like n=1 Tax=Eucalyptus grandis TaxID=71139 RepID=UPI00192E98DF|nr:plant intracellular Ras-group-related LRR protein 5-like [Eucalyptus grandis]
MMPSRSESIINVDSVSSSVGGVASHAYTSSKHAVMGLMRNVATELGRYGIRVNCVSPHFILAPLTKEFFKIDESAGVRVYSNLDGGLPKSICSLKELKTLDASNCASLACIPSSIGHLASLQCLLLWGCSSLREIPDSIGKLESLAELHLTRTAVAELPRSIGNLQNLRILDICRSHITELPGAIGMLTKLLDLRALGCKNLEGLPKNMGELVSLNKLNLEKSGITSLPESISKLSSVQNLSVRYCQKLRGLSELPFGITALRITCQGPALPQLFPTNPSQETHSF